MTGPVTVLRNANILTIAGAAPSDAGSLGLGIPGIDDACGRRAQSVAVADGVVIAVGSDEEVQAVAGTGSTVIDLEGATVLPGFNDAHAHPLVEGLTAEQPRLASAGSLREAMRVLSDRGSRLPPDAWLEATYDSAEWPEARRPTRDDLDRAVHDRPVLLHHSSGHAMVANSLALGLAGLGAGSADRRGRAVLGRDPGGDLDGFVEGSEAYVVFREAIPAPDAQALARAIRSASDRLAADGVTNVTDAYLGATAGLETELRAVTRAVEEDAFRLRLDLLADLAELAPAGDRDPPSPDEVRAGVPAAMGARVRLASGKLFADGVIGLRTAWLEAPYADDPTTSGGPTYPPDELAERVRRAHAAGWQVGVHAVGDAAIRTTLEALGKAMRANPRPDPRHRIEHAMVVPDDLLGRAAELGVTLVVQPGFVAPGGEPYAMRLGGDRSEDLLPFARMLERRVPIAFSSDRPFGPGAPLAGVWAAVDHSRASRATGAARIAAGTSAVGMSAATGRNAGASAAALSVAEALHAWTAGSARASHREAALGRLLAGSAADLIVLDGDPLGETRSVAVRATMVAGRVVAGSLH